MGRAGTGHSRQGEYHLHSPKERIFYAQQSIEWLEIWQLCCLEDCDQHVLNDGKAQGETHLRNLANAGVC